MWDIGGFFTSTEFLIQVAGILSAILAAIAEGLINGLFGVA